MGSGGGGYHDWSQPILPSRIREMEDQAVRETNTRAHNAAVNDLLQDVLKESNTRDTAAVARHMDDLLNAMSGEVAGSLKLLFGGSVKKHTHVEGLSDIDLLVVVNDSSLAGLSPAEILEHFARKIRQRRPSTVVTAGELAITVRYTDGVEIQLLPAFRTQDGLRIKVPFEDRWSHVVRPDSFASKLTEINQSCGAKVVPTIKLYKVLQAALPRAVQLKGYHLESLAIEAFESYGGSYSAKEMLTHLCEVVCRRVLSPIPDRTGQSLHVDDHLGVANSVQRQQVARAITDLVSRLRRADDARDLEAWEDAFSAD